MNKSMLLSIFAVLLFSVNGLNSAELKLISNKSFNSGIIEFTDDALLDAYLLEVVIDGDSVPYMQCDNLKQNRNGIIVYRKSSENISLFADREVKDSISVKLIVSDDRIKNIPDFVYASVKPENSKQVIKIKFEVIR